MYAKEDLLTPSKVERPWRENLTKDGWAINNRIKISKSKCWILHLGLADPGYMYILWILWNERLKSSLSEKDLEVLVDSMLNLCYQCVLASKKPTVSWGTPCPALPARWGKRLSCSTLHWWGLTSSTACRFGHRDIKT